MNPFVAITGVVIIGIGAYFAAKALVKALEWVFDVEDSLQ